MSANSKSDVKYDWYQTDATVVITVLLKNVQQDNIKVEFLDKHVLLSVKLNDEEHNLNFNVSHQVVPEQCSYKITSSKIEMKLKKLDGVRWSKLEGEPEVIEPKLVPLSEGASSGPPPYPTSRKGKDWAAIEKEMKEEEQKEKPDSEEALNKLFQNIYSKGSDDVKMAMNKSYLESGGTVLSTNWEEIKKDKVPIKPPDGLEWKEWN